MEAARTNPIAIPSASKGCPVQKLRMPKNRRWNEPVEDFEAILGGELTTLERVSKIEVREMRIGSPVSEVSQ